MEPIDLDNPTPNQKIDVGLTVINSAIMEIVEEDINKAVIAVMLITAHIQAFLPPRLRWLPPEDQPAIKDAVNEIWGDIDAKKH